MKLKDQDNRDRFVKELNRNFSVIAPAGVGKTRAIVERSVNMALSSGNPEELSSVAVVTYTNKAADEMQQRARNSLLMHPNGALLSGSFNRMFFGTIHSFCVNLLHSFGHHLGIPAQVRLIDGKEIDAVWAEYFLHLDLKAVNRSTGGNTVEECLKYLPAEQLLDLAKNLDTVPSLPAISTPPPFPDISLITSVSTPSSGRSAKSILSGQRAARDWLERAEAGRSYNPIPRCPSQAKAFAAAWEAAFNPLRRWLGQASLSAACVISREFRQFRMSRGLLTYDDQVSLALELVHHPYAGRLIRGMGYKIILDEAQDTDPEQFSLLLEIARPPEASGTWISDSGLPPRQGHFSMVGDPQQSIYGSRASTAFYLKVMEKLYSAAAAEKLTFNVTFRCSKEVVRNANLIFPDALDGSDGQVSYVRLQSRPGAPEGAVVRWQPDESPSSGDKASIGEKAECESRQLARWLSLQSPNTLGARSWDQVAVLCPRKKWLALIETSLAGHGLPVQNLSRHSTASASPAFKWFTALMTCMAYPDNHFETAGVLRDVFGISDQHLYELCEGDPSRLSISNPCAASNPAADILRSLSILREELLALPLADACRRLLCRTGLYEKLASIDHLTGDDSAPVLDQFQAMAASAEADGSDLPQWADTLISLLNSRLEAPEAPRNAIQLLTCQSAKGLEWDCVILPMFFRNLTGRSPAYPKLSGRSENRTQTAVFDSSWLSEDEDNAYRKQVLQETQRLAYVAMTRSRSTLVIADDRNIFGEKGKLSIAGTLGLLSAEQPCWTSLPSSLPQFPRETGTPGLDDTHLLSQFAMADEDAVNRAIELASAFPSRVLPHSLARHGTDAEPEQQGNIDPEWDTRSRDAAVNYGLWWHSLMEILPWDNPDGFDSSFRSMMRSCPDPARGEKEWVMFRHSDAAALLTAGNMAVKTEVQFIYPKSCSECMEGYIDLVAVDCTKGEAVILDWKTDRTGKDRLGILADNYSPQLRAYAEAVRHLMPGLKTVTCMLYSTCNGMMIRLDP